jgi:phospholipid/cholesterol/gamma-HCH transport system substrate-binding protein
VRAISRLFTVLTLGTIVAGVGLLVRVQVRDVSVGETLRTYVLFRDGARISVSSPVVIAGVRVGDIEQVSLEGGLARVDLRLREDIRIPQNSVATRRADKLFGDSYIEIIPGSEPNAPMLTSGQRILHVLEGSSADAILRGIDGALPKADRAMDLTKEAAINSRQWISGPLADGLANSQAWLESGKLEGPIAVIDRSITTFDDWTARATRALRGSDSSVFRTLDRIDGAIRDTRAAMASTTTSLRGVAETTANGLAEIDPVVNELGQVLRDLDAPDHPADQGTLARLINDGELANDLDDAAASGAELMRSTARRFRVLLGLRSEFEVFGRSNHFYVSAEISGRPDSFYLIELSRGPQGGRAAVALTDSKGAGYARTVDLAAKSSFTVQYGKRFGPLALRGGLKESTFGVGADLRLGGRLQLSADLFGSSFSASPNLKLAGAFAVFRSVYVMAGVDNTLTTPGHLPIVGGDAKVPRVLESLRYGRDYFAGASVVFSEDDLATLLRVYGALLVGLL